jgi:hypothetical protein
MSDELLRRVRDTLPAKLNAGMLLGDGGFCILGWMLTLAGFHPITMYNGSLFVADPDPARSGRVVDVVAGLYGLAPEEVEGLGQLNDEVPSESRVEAVRQELDRLLEARR